MRGGYYGRGFNVYRGQKNKARVIAIPQKPGTRPLVSRGVERTRPNNVYVDRRGNVHRRTNNGWQTRTNDRWLQQKVEQRRPLQYTPGTRPVKRKDVHIKRHAGPTLRPPPGTRSPQGGLSPRPMQGQRPQKVDGRWSTQQMDAYQLNRSHNARQLGARRAKSFSGSHRSSGNFSQGRMDGGRHR